MSSEPTALPSPRRRWLLRLSVPAALAGLGLTYWALALSPRPRTAVPDLASAPGRLLADPSLESALWLAYPHQNFGALESRVEDRQAFLEALAELTGSRPLALPSFGPFEVPPARDLALGRDASGELRAAARIDPLIAGLARAAGAVAGNPWLAGGAVSSGGKPARVSWQGRSWSLGPPEPGAAPAPAALSLPAGPAFASLRLGRAADALPPGLYRLGPHLGGGLELDSSRGFPLPEVGSLAQAGAIVVWVEQQAGGARALLLFAGSHHGLPGAAALTRGQAERFKLPGEKILSFLANGLEESEAAGWRIVASDSAARDSAGQVARALTALGKALPRRYLWTDPEKAYHLTHAIAQTLEGIPLVRSKDVKEWKARATLLAPLEPCHRLEAAFGSEEGEARAVLECG